MKIWRWILCAIFGHRYKTTVLLGEYREKGCWYEWAFCQRCCANHKMGMIDQHPMLVAARREHTLNG